MNAGLAGGGGNMREEAGGIGGRDIAEGIYPAGNPWREADHAGNSPAPMSADRLALIGLPRAGLSLLARIAGRHGWRNQRQTDALETLAADAASLPAGSCLIGAIPHAEIAVDALGGFRKLLVIRELRSALVSALRLERELRRSTRLAPIWKLPSNEMQMSRFLQQQGAFLFGQFLSAIAWLTEPDVVTLRFEKLRQPDAALAARLAILLRRHAGSAISGDRQMDPPPRFGEREDFRSFWSDEAELLFAAFGGCQLNRALGYDLAYGTDDHAAH